MCGQDSSVQVLLEDVKVWRRVTKPTNGISPPDTQLVSSYPLKGNVYQRLEAGAWTPFWRPPDSNQKNVGH